MENHYHGKEGSVFLNRMLNVAFWLGSDSGIGSWVWGGGL